MPRPTPFLVFIQSTGLLSVLEQLVTGGEDERAGAGLLFDVGLAAAELLCCTLRAFFSARGQPDTLWWTEYLPLTWPTPLHPGVGQRLKRRKKDDKI